MRFKLVRPSTYGASAVAVIVLLLVLGLWFHLRIGPEGGAEKFPIAWFTIAAAILGSVVNQSTRRQEPRRSPNGWVVLYVLWKSTVAIVFAFVLFLVFVGGLVQGELFPRFVRTTLEAGGGYVNMESFATAVKPEAYKDVAKLLFWSFLAGYSEKFVPNLISKIAGEAASRQAGGGA